MSISEKQNFDVVFIGLGISTILHFLKHSDQFQNKSICFLEKNNKFLINKTIAGFAKNLTLPIKRTFKEFDCQFGQEVKNFNTKIPYQIIDLEKIYEQFQEKSSNCRIIFGAEVDKIEKNDFFKIYYKNVEIQARQLFDSRVPRFLNNNYMKQHFYGWFVKFKNNHNIERPVLMDVDQVCDKFRFVYILPFSELEALVEVTYYSSEVLSKDCYEKELKSYMEARFPMQEYCVYKTEVGAIPLINIRQKLLIKDYQSLGMRDGFLRISTGYSVFLSFFRSRPNTLLILMDQFLLKVLWLSPHLGGKIFTTFLKNINGDTLASFMSYSPSFWSTVKAALAMPKFIFFKHIFKIKGKLQTSFVVREIND